MTSKAEASFVCKSFGANLLPDKAPEVGVKTVLKKKQVRRGRGAGQPSLGQLAGQSMASTRDGGCVPGRPRSMVPSARSTVAPCLLCLWPRASHVARSANRPPPAAAQGDATLSLELNDATLRDPKSLKGVALVAEKPLGCEWAGAGAGTGAGASGAVQTVSTH